jgi:hypothetical protein
MENLITRIIMVQSNHTTQVYRRLHGVVKPVLHPELILLHLLGCGWWAWGVVIKARSLDGRLHLRDSRVRVNSTRLMTIPALHHATNFECDANLEICFIFELRYDGTRCIYS